MDSTDTSQPFPRNPRGSDGAGGGSTAGATADDAPGAPAGPPSQEPAGPPAGTASQASAGAPGGAPYGPQSPGYLPPQPPPGGWPPPKAGTMPADGGFSAQQREPSTAPLGSFFDSLRRSGWYRGRERWVGGVCQGLARRLDLDPVLVRVLVVVATLFLGGGLLLYSLAWVLLPEEHDGRIHLESALQGDVSAGFSGACLGLFLGAVTFDSAALPYWFLSGTPAGFVLALVPLALVVLAVWVLVAWLRSPRGPRDERRHSAAATTYPAAGASWPTPSAAAGDAAAATAPLATPGAGSAPAPAGPGYSTARPTPVPQGTAQPGPAAPHPAPQPVPASAGTSQPLPTFHPGAAAPGAPALGAPANGFQRPAPGAPAPSSPANGFPHPAPRGPVPPYRPVPPAPQTPPNPARPPRPRVLGPGRTVSLLVLGLGLLVVAACSWLLHVGGTQAAVPLVGLGTLAVLLGAAIAFSGLRGRHGGWLSATGVLSLFVLLPALVFGSTAPQLAVRALNVPGLGRTTVVTWSQISSGKHKVEVGIGDVLIDLSDMPADADARNLNVEVGIGDVEVIVPPNRAVRLESTIGVGSLSLSAVSPWQRGGSQVPQTFEADPWQGGQAHTLDGHPLEHYYYEASGVINDLELSSPVKAEALEIRTEIGLGSLHARDTVPATWRGQVLEGSGTWVVQNWSDEYHNLDTSLPVPGTDHPSITPAQSQVCADRAIASAPAGGTRHPVLVEDDEVVSLGTQRYEVYSQCVAETVKQGRTPPAPGTTPGATPSTAPSAPASSPTAEPAQATSEPSPTEG